MREPANRPGGGRSTVILGGILVVLGAWLLVDRFVDIQIDTSWFVPVALVVLGIALVIGAIGRSRSGPA